MDIRTTIYEAVTRMAGDRTVTDSFRLFEELDSISVAGLVADLEDKLNLYPLDSNVEMPDTLGALIGLYEQAAQGTAHAH